MSYRRLALFFGLLGCVGCANVRPTLKQEISAQLAGAAPAFASCYETALTRQAALSGDLLLRFRIEGPTGQFQQVEVAQTTLPDTGLQQCVVSEASKLRLAPAPGTPVSVSYPLSFNPSR